MVGIGWNMPWVVPFGPRVPNMFGFYDDDDESNELAYITVLIVSFYKKKGHPGG